MGQLETIIFDFDGTIADTQNIILQCINELAEKYKFNSVSNDEVEKLRAMHPEDFIKNHLGIPFYKIPILLTEGLNLFAKKRDSILPYDGIIEIIQNLAKEKEIIVVSSNKKEVISSTFGRWGLKCEDIHHCAKLFGKGWELKKIIAKKGVGYDRNKLIYVGDEVRDVYASRMARIGMLAITWGLNNEEAFRNIGFPRDYIVNSPQNMEKRLREL